MFRATDPRSERSACGIGFIADSGGTASRRIVEAGLEALGRMEHRGAVAADGVSGDGAGLLLPIPRELLGSELGASRSERAPESLGVAMLFARGGGERHARPMLERSCEAEGIGVAGWRTVPTDPSVLGPIAAASMPTVVQALLISPPAWGHQARRRASHRVRRRFERLRTSAGLDVSVSSLSFDTVCYKALVRAGELAGFYPDLGDPWVVGWFAVFHQRYSTNTTPAWERAQPFRVLCHNGEINTLSGNVARMRQREGRFGSGDPAAEDLLCASVDEAGSDSSMMDEVVELLSAEGGSGDRARDIRHAVSMVIPRAVDNDPRASEEVRAFVRWNETRMEPWDGPAAIVFADGRVVGAAMDRNGFRPLRYRLDADGLVVCASETGVVDAGEGVARYGRLGPGDMVAVDPQRGGLQLDPVGHIVEGRPYARWLQRERATVLPTRRCEEGAVLARQIAAGLTREDLSIIVRPMAASGTDPTFSMGDDTPLPSLASQPRRVTAFLKQRFAQVTNPPLDHLRESWVMSLRTYLGARPKLLDQEAAREPIVELRSFLLEGRPDGHLLDARWEIREGPSGLERALDRLAAEALTAVRGGARILIVGGTPDRTTAVVPSVLALGATHSALERAGLRTATSLVVEAEDAWTSHEVACLLTCGADAVSLRLAIATVEALEREGQLGELDGDNAVERYHHAVEDGVRRAMARLGISVLESYRGARALDSVGLHGDVVERCFPGVVSMIDGGVDLHRIGQDILSWHAAGFEHGNEQLASPGVVKFRRGGEYHASNPHLVRSLHAAVDPGLRRLRSTAAGADLDRTTSSATATVARTDPRGGASADDREPFARLVSLVERRPPTSPRDLLEILPARAALTVSAVEGVDEIIARFSTGAISLGAISREAHETLARGTALVGARSNSGEGGEDPARFRTPSNSRIKQVASARFGVTPAYCMSAGELQIKIAQGSKPGEGGYLPGRKVTQEIAALRHTQPGIGLISPAPHHDIYSIEDLAQLVHDLQHVNPDAAVSVKLVAEAGVGTVAVGVAKAGADVVHISGGEGGTGASPLSSIKHAGLPWESGLAEVSSSLSEHGLRGRVRLRVDGGFRTGRDVVIAAMLGADEFSFGTAALLAEGCLMVRTCHLDTCPVGIATQRPELRARFAGTPDMVARYLTLVADDVRRILASSGLRSIDDAIDRVDLLRPTEGAVGLDVACLLRDRRRAGGHAAPSGPRSPERSLGERVTEDGLCALARVGGTERRYVITNRDRSVGCRLGGAIAQTSDTDRPRGTFTARFEGDAGQSFGAFLSPGVAFHLSGTANDGVGKGMAGGTIAVAPTSSMEERPSLIGDSALYGATGGELFVAGEAGQRFAVRNCGATSVVEGLGANGCEYMTGGWVLVLGPIGPNFAAGMTGGHAYLLDPHRSSVCLVNRELVDVAALDPEGMRSVEQLLRRHLLMTGSTVARDLLRSWPGVATEILHVRPRTEGSLEH